MMKCLKIRTFIRTEGYTGSLSSTRKTASIPTDTSPPIAATPSGKHSGGLQRSDTLREDSTSPVKDLSELFAVSVSSKPKRVGLSPRPSGVAKRMHPLRRAQTDSSVGAASGNERTPQRLGATRTESIIDLTLSSTGGTNSPVPGPSNSRPSTPYKGQLFQLDESSPAVRPSLTGPSTSGVRTYAGKSRSFLVALPG